jgi:hypothetical protein
MEERNEVQLAETIIQLDIFRDQLYEELMEKLGTRAPELLRRIQNGACFDGRKQK